MDHTAKLLLRGTLITKTAKNLTPQQIKEVEDYCEEIWKDPGLAHTKTAFCSRLSWTFGREYRDAQVALQEIWIVYWKTTIDILYHRPKKQMAEIIGSTCLNCKTTKLEECICTDPDNCDKCHGDKVVSYLPDAKCPACGETSTLSAGEDFLSMGLEEARATFRTMTGKTPPPVDLSLLKSKRQMRKFYKTTLWTYFKQMTKEMKPRKKAAFYTTIYDYAEKIAVELVKDALLDRCADKPEETDDGIIVDTKLISLDALFRIREVMDMFIQHNVNVRMLDNRISIERTGPTQIMSASIRRKSEFNFYSLSTIQSDPEVQAENLIQEAHATSLAEVDMLDGLLAIRQSLSGLDQKIFDIIISPPKTFSDQFSTQPVKRANVAKFLGISKKEVDCAWEKIQNAAVKAGYGDL